MTHACYVICWEKAAVLGWVDSIKYRARGREVVEGSVSSLGNCWPIKESALAIRGKIVVCIHCGRNT